MNTLEMLQECRNIISSCLVGPPLPDNLAYGTNNIPSMVTGEIAKAEDVNTMGRKLASSIARLADGSQAVGKANKFVSSTGTPTHILTATAGTGDVAAVPKTIAEMKGIFKIYTPTPSKIIVFDAFIDRMMSSLPIDVGRIYLCGNANDKAVECTIAGVTGAKVPTWGAIGTTQVWGTATFKVIARAGSLNRIYTPTPGTKKLRVICIGGGCGGATLSDRYCPGTGGGGIDMFLDASASNVPVTIGTGGFGDGAAGGTSSFGAYGSATGGTQQRPGVGIAGSVTCYTRAFGEWWTGWYSGTNASVTVNNFGGSGAYCIGTYGQGGGASRSYNKNDWQIGNCGAVIVYEY